MQTDPRKNRKSVTPTAESLDLYGHLDLAVSDRVEGWLVARNDPARRRKTMIILNEKHIAEVIAGDFRKDLKIADIGVGDGCYALSYRLPTLAPGDHVIRVVDSETGYELQNSPQRISVPFNKEGTPQAELETIGFSSSELELARHLEVHFAQTTNVKFGGQYVSVRIINCNPYHVTAVAFAQSTYVVPIPLQLRINDQDVAATLAVSDPWTMDGGTACLYRFQVPKWFLVEPGMPVQLSLSGKPVPMSGDAPQMTCRFVGALNRCDSRVVSGWAACLDALDQRVRIDILVGGQIYDSTVAASRRPDLHSLGLADTNHGFLLEFPEPLDLQSGSEIAVQALVHGMGYELQYSPWYVSREPRRMQMQELLARARIHGATR